MTGQERLEYEKRVNRVIDHIQDHLGEVVHQFEIRSATDRAPVPV